MANGLSLLHAGTGFGIYWKSADGIGEDELLASLPAGIILSMILCPTMEKSYASEVDTNPRSLNWNAVYGRQPGNKTAASGKV